MLKFLEINNNEESIDFCTQIFSELGSSIDYWENVSCISVCDSSTRCELKNVNEQKKKSYKCCYLNI